MQRATVESHPYFAGRTAVIATMHAKERVIAPLLERYLEVNTVVPTDFNTDQFGTFTGEIKRAGDQWSAARAKAHAAALQTSCDLVVASEGSFNPDPKIPFIAANLELVILIDTKYNLEITGLHQYRAPLARAQQVSHPDEVCDIATAWGFPAQGVILRPNSGNSKRVYKDYNDLSALRAASHALLSRPWHRSLTIETDLRAHRCPARMDYIATATQALLENCQRRCPTCNTPGFTPTNMHPGLPCAWCTRATDTPRSYTYTCLTCQYSEERAVSEKTANPGSCTYCNP